MTYTTTQQAFGTSGAKAVHNVTRASTSKTQDLIAHELHDNGAGTFGPYHGVVNYTAKTLQVRVASQDSRTQSYSTDYENAEIFAQLGGSGQGGGGSDSAKGGVYTTAAVSEELLAGGNVYVIYSTGFTVTNEHTQNFAPPLLTIDLCPLSADYVVPGSVQFTWMGHVYRDFEGVIYRGRTDVSPGVASGTMDYSQGLAHMTDWVVSGSPDAFTLDSLWTRRQAWKTATIMMRTQAAPLAPGGFVMVLTDTVGNSLSATADPDGLLVGAHMLGRLDYQTGVAEIQFGDFVLDSSLTPAQKAEWWYDADDVGAVQADKIWRPWPVDPTTLRYNSVAYYYLPIDADILGLDPVRLPQDGRVPMVRKGGHIVIGHSGFVGPATASNGQTINMGRERLSRIRLKGSNGQVIQTGYTVDLNAGTLNVVDVTGWAQPVTYEHRIEQLIRVGDVQIDGTLGLVGQLAHDFPVGSVVSSALVAGNLKARVSNMWDQSTWNQVWTDGIVGSPALANYSGTVTVTNAGAVTQRYAFIVRTSSTFECFGEYTGSLGTHSMNATFAPMNPDVGVPFFTMPPAWGEGWIPNNVHFLHTVGAQASFAAIRTVQMGPAAGIDYEFEILGRGDVDREPSNP
ncbi:hypothetical protein LJR118_000298 [Acidovorax sp. LjRoot118]|uniref:hypothetical protein n=1 Tax=Acidovorax sp. LjRoot118 TaxID=3342256 RepID=UPI003ECFEB98